LLLGAVLRYYWPIGFMARQNGADRSRQSMTRPLPKPRRLKLIDPVFLELARIIRRHFNAEMDSHQFL
jgi:hypothetical protein